MTDFPERVFSGMQPTGNLHLGNFLGAMLNWVRMQETHDCIYCVVDMHAITTWQEPETLAGNIREVTAAYIACGLDRKKASSSTRARFPPMPNSPGCSTAWRAWAGSTG